MKHYVIGEDNCFVEAYTKRETIDKIYPIGSIYMSLNNVSPESLFGGKWKKLEDVFLFGAGSSHELNSRGGEKTHTLSKEEMPFHEHVTAYTQIVNVPKGAGATVPALVYGDQIYNGITGGAGSSQPHNNMPPYLAVNIWTRIG